MNRARPRTGVARRRFLQGTGGAALAVLTACSALGLRPALADDDFTAPVEDELKPIRIGVFGDSLADGIWAGLYRTLHNNERFEVARHTEVSSGLARSDFFDWEQELDQILTDETIDVAVVCLGLNDNQPVYYDGRGRFQFGSEEWDAIYRERVDAILARLEQSEIPTFWVGLPTVRDEDFGLQMSHLNAIYEAQALAADVTFVSTFALTGDADGAYSAYLADEEGRNRLMRANDGVHFTGRGYELLAKALLAVMHDELPTLPVDEYVNG
jgi:uncharacterized protein